MSFSSLRVLKGVLKYKALGGRTPINVSISVTNRCNMKCSYCDIPYRRQREMTTDEIKSIIDDLKKLGCVRLGLWGGEPLIRDDIGELVSYSKGRGLYTTIISNGILVPEKMEKIKDIDMLFLSLDGPEDIQDKNRKPGSFEAVMRAIKSARENKIPVTTITVLTEENSDQVDYVIKKAEKMGFACTFQLIYNDKFDDSKKETDYKPVIRKLIELKKNGKPVASSFSYLRHLLEWPDYRKTAIYPKEKTIIKCYGNMLFCNIDTDGKIYPCDWMREKTKGSDSLVSGFTKAWKDAPLPDCGGCLKSCYTEYNKMLSFDMDAIKNGIKLVKS